jgi:Zn ribbon nucleic-acid-binding protein
MLKTSSQAKSYQDSLWRDFPKTAAEFEAKFASEADCIAYWIEARCAGTRTYAKCNSTRLWVERDGVLFECAACGHQTSLVSETLLEERKNVQGMVPRDL